MPISINPFRIEVVDPKVRVLPGIYDDDVTIPYVTAIMKIGRGLSVSCQWWTDDVDGTLRDFAEEYTFPLDPHMQFDRFHSVDEVHLQYRSRRPDGSDSSAIDVATMTEDEYYRAVDMAVRKHREWCSTDPRLAGRMP